MRTAMRGLKFGVAAFAFCAHSLCASPLPSATAEVPEFFGIRAGATFKSAAESILGTPANSPAADTYEYRSVAGAADIARELIEYFPDTHQVARLDAYLKAPLAAATLRAQFGTPVLARQRSDGKREELFFPRMNGLIFSADKPDEVIAISYLSPRALADLYVDQYNKHAAAKRYPEALEAANNAVQADPDYARGYLSQGLYYYFQNNLDEALVRFVAASRARYSAQKKAHAHVWMGIVHKKKKQPDAAREEFQKALAMAPEFFTAHYEYGVFLQEQNQPDLAEAAWLKALMIDPDNHSLRFDIGRMHARRSAWAKALPYFKQLSDWADSPASTRAETTFKVDIYTNYARTYNEVEGARNPLAGSELSERVIALYEKGLRLEPGNTSICNNIGYEYERTRRLDKAEQYYRQGLASDPKHAILNQNLADVLLGMRRYEEARRQAEVAHGIDPKNTLVIMIAARASAALRMKEEALGWLRKAADAGYQARMDGDALEGGFFRSIMSDDELRRMLPGRRG